MTPDPSALGRMTPAERKAYIDANKEKAQQKARERLAEHRAAIRKRRDSGEPLTYEERKELAKQARQDADEELSARCREEARFPVRMGNLMGPEGNVFNVIACVKQGIRWAEARGAILPEEAYDIVREYRNRSYDDTLRLVEEYAFDLDGALDGWWTRDPDPEFDDRAGLAAQEIRWGDNPVGAILGQGARVPKR